MHRKGIFNLISEISVEMFGTCCIVSWDFILGHVLFACVNFHKFQVNSGIGGYQLVNNAVESGGHTHGLAGGPLPFKELASVIVGAICPTLLASGHSH